MHKYVFLNSTKVICTSSEQNAESFENKSHMSFLFITEEDLVRSRLERANERANKLAEQRKVVVH